MTDPSLPVNYNTLPLVLMGIPLAVASVYSLKIADKVGYENLIRATAIM